MARNDGIHRTVARNNNLSASKIANAQRHNEREKESYTNPDIVPEHLAYNVHYKSPTGSYTEMFEQMKADGIISTRGLKDDAKTYGELIFDVNSAYFYNHCGYEFAKQFYAGAYKAAMEIVGGEEYILSAVMHEMNVTVLCLKLWEKMFSITTCTWCTSRLWKNRFSGANAARTNPSSVQ